MNRIRCVEIVTDYQQTVRAALASISLLHSVSVRRARTLMGAAEPLCAFLLLLLDALL